MDNIKINTVLKSICEGQKNQANARDHWVDTLQPGAQLYDARHPYPIQTPHGSIANPTHHRTS